MIDRRRIALAATVAFTAAACAPGSDADSTAGGGTQVIVDQGGPEDAIATDITAPEPTAPTTDPAVAVSTSDSSFDATEPEPGMFSDDQTTELAVSILVSQTGLGNGQSRPISFAVGLANRDVEFEGSPFEFGVDGTISAPVAYNDDGDLTEDPDKLRAGIDEMLESPFTDLFVGAVPPSLVEETTALAADRGIPLALVNHVDDGSVPQLGVRIDIAGSIDLSYRALVDVAVATGSDGIVVIGAPSEPGTELVRQLLSDAGATPDVIDATDGPPSPSEIAAARERIGSVGDRPTVILLARLWASPLIETMASTRSNPAYISTDLTLGRADVASIAALGDGELTVVRRVDQLRRPEQAEFVARLFFERAPGSTTFAAESYDAYALAAIAVAAAGSADHATVRQGMIEASRQGEPCSVLAECLTLASNGVDVDYDGQSGPIELDDNGVATAAWFSIDVVDPATGGDATSRFELQQL